MQAKDIPANASANAVVATGRTDRLFYQPLSHMGLKWGAQAFTGAPTTRPDTYPHVNAACDLTDKIGVTKNALNLKQLENITECTYSDAVASTSKIVEVEELPKLLERFTSLELSDKDAQANCQREKHRKLQLEKKFAKSLEKGKGKAKEPVHSAPINKDAGNIRVFEETPIEERLDWGTDSAEDDQGDLNNEIAESARILDTAYRHSSLFDDGDPNESRA